MAVHALKVVTEAAKVVAREAPKATQAATQVAEQVSHSSGAVNSFENFLGSIFKSGKQTGLVEGLNAVTLDVTKDADVVRHFLQLEGRDPSLVSDIVGKLREVEGILKGSGDVAQIQEALVRSGLGEDIKQYDELVRLARESLGYEEASNIVETASGLFVQESTVQVNGEGAQLLTPENFPLNEGNAQLASRKINGHKTAGENEFFDFISRSSTVLVADGAMPPGLVDRWGNILSDRSGVIVEQTTTTTTRTSVQAGFDTVKVKGPDGEMVERILPKGTDADVVAGYANGERNLDSIMDEMVQSGPAQPSTNQADITATENLRKSNAAKQGEDIASSSVTNNGQVVEDASSGVQQAAAEVAEGSGNKAAEVTNNVVDKTVDSLVGIIERQVMDSGSGIGMTLDILRAGGADIPTGAKIKDWLHNEVVNQNGFRELLRERILGNKVSTKALNGTQKKIFMAADYALWGLEKAPKGVLEWLPRIGGYSKFIRGHLKNIPVIGGLLAGALGALQTPLSLIGQFRPELESMKDIMNSEEGTVTEDAVQATAETKKKK